MNKLALYMAIAIVLLVGALGLSVRRYQAEKAERIRIHSNLKERTRSWQDERGLLVNQVSTLEITTQELRETFRRERDEIVNNYEKRIYAFKEEVDNLKLDVKRLRGIIATSVVVVDTIIVEVETKTDDVVTGEYRSKFLDANISYFPKKDYFSMDYQYRDSINVLRVVSAKPRKDGTPRKLFPNCIWLWGEQEEYISYSKNEKSEVRIEIATEIRKR
ncbi:MAG: hypothetical protein WC233_03630 [Sphaerochaeta sp.]